MLGLFAVFYQFGLDGLTDALLPSGLAVRVLAAVVVLAPVGLCLGMFMPLGLTELSRFSPEPERSVAWAWAVNGFFSVIGSVLTTILSMTFGFRVVMFLALVAYAAAVVSYGKLRSTEQLGAERSPAPEPAAP